MSSPGIASETPRNEFRWKRLFIRAAGFGAGFALMIGISVSVGIWYLNRPKPAKPWNSKAIVASYRNLNVDSDQTITFTYTLANNTDEDFRLTKSDAPEVGMKIDSPDTFAEFNTYTKIDLPVILPARKKALVILHLDMTYPEKLKANPTQDERDEYRQKVEEFLRKEGVISGFVLLDSSRRYQIDFPAGWEQTKPKK